MRTWTRIRERAINWFVRRAIARHIGGPCSADPELALASIRACLDELQAARAPALSKP